MIERLRAEMSRKLKSLNRFALYALLIGVLCIGCTSSNSKKNEGQRSTKGEAVFLEPDALKLRADQVGKIAEAITVLIETPSGSGSGVIVRKSGDRYTIATASHVIKSTAKGEELTAKTHDGKRHQINLDNASHIDRADLSLIEFSSKDEYAVGKIGAIDAAKPGQIVYVSGFPMASSAVPNQILRTLKGSIIANSAAYIKNGYQLLYTNPTLPGMSGGAVLNEKGGLIGIHGQAEIDTALTANEGVAVKTGTNQAVPVSYLPYKKSNESSSVILDPAEAKASTLIARAAYAMAQIKEIQDQMEFQEGYEYRGRFQGNSLITELAKESIRLLDKAIETKETSHAYYLRATYKLKGSGRYKLLDYSTESATKDLLSALRMNQRNTMALVYYARLSGYEEAEKRNKLREPYTENLKDKKYGTRWDSMEYKDKVLAEIEAREIWSQDRDVNKMLKKELKSFRLLEKAISIDPYYTESYTEYCDQLLWPTLMRARECLEVLDKAIRLSPTVARLHYYRGKAYVALAEEPGAHISHYEWLMHWKLAKKGEYLSERALALKKKEQKELLERAIKSYELAAELDPSSGIAYLESGFAKSSIGNHLGAAEDIGRVIALSKYPPLWMPLRAKYYQDAGEERKAENEYLRVLDHELSMDDIKIEAAFSLADLYRKRNNQPGACKYFGIVNNLQRANGKSPILSHIKDAKDKALGLERYCSIKLDEDFFGFNY